MYQVNQCSLHRSAFNVAKKQFDVPVGQLCGDLSSPLRIFVKEQPIAEGFEGLTRVSAISISSLLLTPVKYPH